MEEFQLNQINQKINQICANQAKEHYLLQKQIDLLSELLILQRTISQGKMNLQDIAGK